MKNNYLYRNPSYDPCYNLALEEHLLTHYTEGAILMLWKNQNTIVVGRHQNTVEEINQKYVLEHNIQVVRRTTGGGAVYHDLGNLNYSFITDRRDDGENEMRLLTEPVVRALERLGVKASFEGRNDIVIEGQKVSGTAQRIWRNRILHHGCLLFDSDLSVLSKCLNVRSEKFCSKSVKSVRSRVANIRDFLSEDMTVKEFEEYMVRELLGEGEYEPLVLTDEDRACIKSLRDLKYAAWEWNYGQPLGYTVHNYKKYDGGTVEVYINVKEDRIKDCRMYGDFMALCPASEVAAGLTGRRYQYEDVLRVLKGYRISDYFGEISAEEVAACICAAGDCKEP